MALHTPYKLQKPLEITEGAIKNGQSRDWCNNKTMQKYRKLKRWWCKLDPKNNNDNLFQDISLSGHVLS